MAQRTDNTMVEFLQKLLKDIAVAKLLPDADMAFFVQMETAIIQEAKKQGGSGSPDAMTQAGLLPQAAQGAPTRGGVMGSPSMPSPDEMQRMLAPGQGLQ